MHGLVRDITVSPIAREPWLAGLDPSPGCGMTNRSPAPGSGLHNSLTRGIGSVPSDPRRTYIIGKRGRWKLVKIRKMEKLCCGYSKTGQPVNPADRNRRSLGHAEMGTP